MIDYEKRAMIEAEDKYTFRQSSQISSQTGLIGYLRADMDTDGNGFFSSWNDYRKDLKTDEFKQEFDEVINSLREEGDILHNRKDLAYYCYTNPQSKMPTEQDYYGVRVDTDKYTYLLRLNPNKGEYNLYCYCYVKDWLNGHMKDAAKGIRFINSHYKELFRIPDGGKIKIHLAWNEDQVRTCRYIDDYHVEIGDNLYHICEFAERMEQNGHTYEPVRTELPEQCYSILPGSGEIIVVKRNEKGYYMVGYSDKHKNIGSFRIDRICKQPRVLGTDAVPKPEDFDINDYLNTMFRMYNSERCTVELVCDNSVMDAIIDRFGEDVKTYANNMNTFRAEVEIAANHVFYSWVFGFGGRVRIKAPDNVRAEYAEMVKNAVENLDA